VGVEVGTPASNAKGMIVRSVGAQTVNGTVTSNQGTAAGKVGTNAWQANLWADSLATPGTANVQAQIDDSSFAGLGFRLLMTEPYGSAGQPLQQDGSNNLKVAQQGIVAAAQPINGAIKTLTPTANHLAANGTTTLTAADAWISTSAVTVDVIGTASTITIQDKSATPKKLVNGLSTTTLSTAPTSLSFPQPVLMTGGIDVVTAGTVAGTEDVWVDYWQ